MIPSSVSVRSPIPCTLARVFEDNDRHTRHHNYKIVHDRSLASRRTSIFFIHESTFHISAKNPARVVAFSSEF